MSRFLYPLFHPVPMLSALRVSGFTLSQPGQGHAGPSMAVTDAGSAPATFFDTMVTFDPAPASSLERPSCIIGSVPRGATRRRPGWRLIGNISGPEHCPSAHPSTKKYRLPLSRISPPFLSRESGEDSVSQETGCLGYHVLGPVTTECPKQGSGPTTGPASSTD